MRFARQLFASLLTVASCLVVAALPSHAQGIRYEVSEQTSVHRVSGWEHTLTDRDPNLRNWHWEPITTSNHNVNVRKFVDPSDPNAGNAAPVMKYEQSHYVKPIHVPMPTVVRNGGGYNGSANSRSQSDVAGKLMRSNNNAPITAQARPVATYKDYAHGDVAAASTAARVNVSGNIIHKSGRRAACNESPKYF